MVPRIHSHLKFLCPLDTLSVGSFPPQSGRDRSAFSAQTPRLVPLSRRGSTLSATGLLLGQPQSCSLSCLCKAGGKFPGDMDSSFSSAWEIFMAYFW